MNDSVLDLTCSSGPTTRYLEGHVLPVLLPGLKALLMKAQKDCCMKRKKMAFNGCDFLTEWLYNKNPCREECKSILFHEIPFVKDWLPVHPRQCIPVSPLLTDEQAAPLIQAFWRGYKVRVHPDVQELRLWQIKQREKNCNIIKIVQEFWARQENRVWSELVELRDRVDQHAKAGVAIEVVPDTAEKSAVYTGFTKQP